VTCVACCDGRDRWDGLCAETTLINMIITRERLKISRNPWPGGCRDPADWAGALAFGGRVDFNAVGGGATLPAAITGGATLGVGAARRRRAAPPTGSCGF
jgi:hypothetical protein